MAELDGLIKIMEEAANSSSIAVQDKHEILETLLGIQKLAVAIFDLVEADKAFHPATVSAIHRIEQEGAQLRMRLAGEILKRDPGALYFAMRINEMQEERERGTSTRGR